MFNKTLMHRSIHSFEFAFLQRKKEKNCESVSIQNMLDYD